MRQIIHNPWIREKIEYVIGGAGYLISWMALDPFVNKIIGSAISFLFGIILVILTHFIKRFLVKKFPINEED